MPPAISLVVTTPPLIAVAPEIVDQPNTVIRGVLLHELGHALVDLKVYKPAKKRTYDARERHADVVAKDASGLHIFYGKKDKVQRAGQGAKGLKRRPKNLK